MKKFSNVHQIAAFHFRFSINGFYKTELKIIIYQRESNCETIELRNCEVKVHEGYNLLTTHQTVITSVSASIMIIEILFYSSDHEFSCIEIDQIWLIQVAGLCLMNTVDLFIFQTYKTKMIFLIIIRFAALKSSEPWELEILRRTII